MLGFIQKYQKIIFAVVAILVCTSFLFFGVLPRGGSTHTDKVVYQTAHNQKVKASKFEGLKAMLTTHNGEYTLFGPALGPHYFSESFLISDLIKPGLLHLILEKHQKELASEWKKIYEKDLAYTSYVHPHAPFLKADTIWSIHAPQIEEGMKSYRGAKTVLEQFDSKQKLLLEESKFPSLALWQVLSDQEKQFDWIPKDPNLKPQNLNLFGYQRVEDWIGEQFLNKICEFIFEVNALAKESGYHLTDQEVERDLLQLNEQNYRRLKSLGIEDFEDSHTYFESKMRRLGLNKVQVIQLWKELLTFRRFFHESKNLALLDSIALQPFEQYANKKLKVARYTLPDSMKLCSMKDLVELEVYLEVLGKPMNQLDLDFKMKSISEIAKNAPQLVERPVELQYKEVDVATAALQVKTQDIWNWKLDPKNKELLTKKFPMLSDTSPELFQEQLENLEPFVALQMDQFIRELLLRENTDWLSKAFALAETRLESIYVRYTGQGLPFENLELSEDKTSFLSQFFDQSQTLEQQEPFTFDKKHYYQVIAKNQAEQDRLVPYETLKKERHLEKLVRKKLADFSGLEHLSTGQSEQKIAAELIAPLKKAIVKDYLVTHKDHLKEFSDEFYTQYRFYPSMKKALNFMKENEKKGELYAFNALWTLQERPCTHVRYLSSEGTIESLCGLKEGQWTAVESRDERLEFSRLLSKPKGEGLHTMQKKVKKQLQAELTQAAAKEILDLI